jgi:hypothetical protein
MNFSTKVFHGPHGYQQNLQHHFHKRSMVVVVVVVAAVAKAK